MSYIEIQAEKIIQAVQEKRKKVLEIDTTQKEVAIKNSMTEKIGWFWSCRFMTHEEATIDVSRWWDKSQALRGFNRSMNRLDTLDALAKTSAKIGNGMVQLNKEDNNFLFGDGDYL